MSCVAWLEHHVEDLICCCFIACIILFASIFICGFLIIFEGQKHRMKFANNQKNIKKRKYTILKDIIDTDNINLNFIIIFIWK